MRTTGARNRASTPAGGQANTSRTRDLANRRTSRRYPAWIDITLFSPEANTSTPATIVDLSLGGALIQTHQSLQPGDTVSTTISTPLGPITLAGPIVRVENSWTGSMLHVEFQPLEPMPRLSLCRLLDELESEFRRHQLGIAGARL